MTPSLLTNFGYVETTNCVPANVDFKDSTTTCGVTIASWAWDFGDGQTSTAQNPSHIYAATGTYSVTLTTTDNLGNSLPKNISVTVTATGMPIVNLGADTTICSIDALTLDAGNPGSTYAWESGETTQTLYVDFPGTYSVIVTSPSGCVVKDTLEVNMLPSLYADFSFTQSGTCLPINVAFTDNSIICGVTIDSWSWDFGDGNLSSAQNPTHDYMANGTYNVTLSITDNLGNTLSKITPVTIAGLVTPVVNLGADTTICSMDALTLDAGNPGSTYEWSFGGETTQTVLADFPATYAVKVTGANGCVSSDTLVLNMNPSLLANFGYALTGACLPQTVDFSDSTTVCGVTIDSWAWDFGDGQTSSAPSPTHIYTGNGTYAVTLTVTDNLGNSLTSSKPVTISAFTPASLYLGADTIICSGSSVTLDAGTPGSTYLWSTGASSQTIAATSGSYWVELTTPGGCVSKDTIEVTSNAMPVFSLGADRIACGNITLDAFNPGMTYVWSTGETTSDIEVMSSGTYSVTVTNLPGCIKSDTVNITFQQPVVAQIGQSFAGTCSNMVQFTDNSIICSTVSIVSRTWEFGDGTTSTQPNPSHTYTGNGIFIVKLTLNDDQGGVNVKTSSVSVMVNPPVPDLGNDIDVCPGTPVTLDAGTTGGIYKWFPAGLTSDSTSPTLTFIPTADMNVKLSVTACNQTGWDSIRIYVRNNTKPTLNMVGKALQSSAANSYNWFVNGTLIPSATNKMYTPKQPGYYQVGTINDYLCPSLSDSVFYMPTGKFKAGDITIRLSPNPTKGVFTVWLSKAPTKPVRMEIFTADGKLAYNTLIHSQVSTIYPGHLTRGAYMVRFIINGSVETIPLIEL